MEIAAQLRNQRRANGTGFSTLRNQVILLRNNGERDMELKSATGQLAHLQIFSSSDTEDTDPPHRLTLD